MSTEKWTCCPFQTGLMPNVQSVKPWVTQEQEAILGQWSWSSFSQREDGKVSLLNLPFIHISQCYRLPLPFLSILPAARHKALHSIYISSAHWQACFLLFKKCQVGGKFPSFQPTNYILNSRYFFPCWRKRSKLCYHFPKTSIWFWLRFVNLEIYVSQAEQWILWLGQDCVGDCHICMIRQFPWGSDWSAMVSKILTNRIIHLGWSMSWGGGGEYIWNRRA